MAHSLSCNLPLPWVTHSCGMLVCIIILVVVQDTFKLPIRVPLMCTCQRKSKLWLCTVWLPLTQCYTPISGKTLEKHCLVQHLCSGSTKRASISALSRNPKTQAPLSALQERYQSMVACTKFIFVCTQEGFHYCLGVFRYAAGLCDF